MIVPETEAFVPEPFHLPLWLQITLICVLLCLSGLFSGLNLGLMALDQNDLKVIASCGTKQEKKYAATILPLRSRGNYLLCTLLLGNVLVNTTLTALLDDVSGSGLFAVIIATLSITVIGEILPQAICSRHGLAVGAKTICIPYLFMALTAPLSYPISRLLDKLLGEEIGCVYNREQLMEYIRITREYNRLEDNEVGIISGALALKSKVAGDILTPIEDVFSLPIETKLNYSTVTLINERGFSRIPVYADADPSNIVGLLHTRDLALIDPGDSVDIKTVLEYHNHPLVYVYTDTRLDLVLEEFKKGKSHMALVRSIQTKVIRNNKRNSRKISVVDGDIFNQDKYRPLHNNDNDKDMIVDGSDDKKKDMTCISMSASGGDQVDGHNEDGNDDKDGAEIDDCLIIKVPNEATIKSPLKSTPTKSTDARSNVSINTDAIAEEDEDVEEPSESASEEGDPYYRLDGIITLEDIIEEILGAEIVDESDILAMKLRDKLKEKGISSSKKYSTITSPYYLSRDSRGSGQFSGASGTYGQTVSSSFGANHCAIEGGGINVPKSGLSSQRPSYSVPSSAPPGSVPSSLSHHPLSVSMDRRNQHQINYFNHHMNHQHTYPDFNCSNELVRNDADADCCSLIQLISSDGHPNCGLNVDTGHCPGQTGKKQSSSSSLISANHQLQPPTMSATGQRPQKMTKNGRFLLRMSSSPTFKNVPNPSITSTTSLISSSNQAAIKRSPSPCPRPSIDGVCTDGTDKSNENEALIGGEEKQKMASDHNFDLLASSQASADQIVPDNDDQNFNS